MQIVEGHIVLKARTALTLVLTSARVGRSRVKYRDIVLITDCVHSSIASVYPHLGIERILVGEQRIVEPAIGAVLPAGGYARVGVLDILAGRRRVAGADAVDLCFVAILHARFEAIVVGQLPIEFTEIEIFGERQTGRPELRLYAWRQQARGGDTAQGARATRGHRDRRGEPLALVGYEEMQLILDDRSA